MSQPYSALFPTGTRVSIASRRILEEFRDSWTLHHPIESPQIAFAGSATRVVRVGFYHGGDALYELEGIPGIWHERCLVGAPPTGPA